MTPPPAAATVTTPVRRRPIPATRPARPTRRRAGGAPVLPRRVSGPVRARTRPRARARAHTAPTHISHRLLDRLIGGRAWIGIVAFALIGIVAMQLWIVKLGVGIGHAIEHEGLLRRENSALSIEDAQLASGERVEQLAAARGMVEAAPGALHFDSVRGSLDARQAAAVLARDAQASTAAASTATTASTASATTASQTSTPAPTSPGGSSEAASTGTSSEASSGEASGQTEETPGG